MHKRSLIVILMIILTLSFVGTAFANGGQESSGGSAQTGQMEKITARMPSEEIEGDFMTVWAKKFADHMREWSDGQIDITVYPYGTLGDSRDVVEVTQMGVTELVFADYGWLSSFVPQTQVLALHYLWPKDKMPQTLEWVVKNGDAMPLLEKYYRNNGFVPLGIMYEGWQWVTSKSPKIDMNQYNGFKVRVMGSKMLVEDYKAYGSNPTPMSYGEVYSGLQTGLIEGQVNPLFAIYSMKFYEVQNYLTQLWAEPFVGIPTANKQWFDALPEAAQQEMKRWWADAIIPAAKWIDDRNASDRKKMMEDKPNLKFTELTADEIKPYQEAAKKVYPTFVKIGGDGAQQVLDTLLADIDNAKQAVGAK